MAMTHPEQLQVSPEASRVTELDAAMIAGQVAFKVMAVTAGANFVLHQTPGQSQQG